MTINKEITGSNNLSDKLYKALTIKERSHLIDKLECYKNIEKKDLENTLSKWKKETSIVDSILKLRLDSEDLTLNLFSKVLYSSQNNDWIDHIKISDLVKPLWMKEIDKAFELNRKHKITEISESDSSLSFAFRPFMLFASEKIYDYFGNKKNTESFINSSKLIDSIITNLEELLVQMGTRTIVFELHIAKEMGELTGTNSKERFNSFIQDKLLNPEYLEFIYSEYPVLARLLITKTMYYIQNITQCIDHFINDYSILNKTFKLDNEILIGIKTDLGDSHQQGKTVMKFQFSSGKELLYKPKSLQLLKHFNNLLEWFNSKGFKPKFKNYKTINYKDYCWEERVEYNNCDSYEQLQKYYKRLGGLIGILYIVDGIDFHSENIIANGEFPMLIDIETLFHPRLKLLDEFTGTAGLRAREIINNSVLNIGLLPHLTFKTPEGKGIDLGGISNTEALLPIPLLTLENDQTDDVRFIFKDFIINEADQNVPKMSDEMIDPTDFTDEIIEGFKEIGEIIYKNKNDLTHKDSILSQFKNDSIRVILRGTQHYGNFILESTHPDYLRDWIERDKLMDKIWHTVLDTQVIAHEKNDLLNNDIPFFYTKPNSLNLISSNGTAIKNFYNQTSFNTVIERIKNLSKEDILKQIELIKMSMLSNKKTNEKNLNYPKKSMEEIEINTKSFIKEAILIGDKLIEQSIQGEFNDITWISLDTNYFGQWDVSVLEEGMYNGLSGILIFSSYLYKITKEDRFKKLSEKVCESILEVPLFSRDFKSAFFGQASTIYALSHYIKIFGENERIISYINERVEFLGENIEADKYFDLLGGSAGIIQILLNVYDQIKIPKASEYAIRYGNHLLNNQQKRGGWINSSFPKALGGFSHGTSGIAWSLLRLYEYSNDKKHIESALKAIEFDRSLYNSSNKNWNDLRYNKLESISWCHGAPGIGMSRILYLDYINDIQLNNEIKISLSTTLEKGFGRSHSLCHGDLGNSELFCLYAIKFNENKYLEIARKIAMNVIKEKNENGKFKTGVPNNIEIPGLFLGLSGIGLQLLRLADPKNIPSVLTLQ